MTNQKFVKIIILVFAGIFLLAESGCGDEEKTGIDAGADSDSDSDSDSDTDSDSDSDSDSDTDSDSDSDSDSDTDSDSDSDTDSDSDSDSDSDTDSDSDSDTDTDIDGGTDTDADTDASFDAGPLPECDILFGDEEVLNENFDSYEVDSYIAYQAGDPWTTWTYSPGDVTLDAWVSSSVSVSPSNSLKIVGGNDTVLIVGDSISSGVYQIQFQMLVESDCLGYFNLLQNFWTEAECNAGGDPQTLCLWGIQVFFDPGGMGVAVTAGEVNYFNFAYDDWFDVSISVDLDDDLATFCIGDGKVASWQWSLGSSGYNASLTLDAVNFYGKTTASDGMTIAPASYYVDDISVTKL